MGVKIAGVDGNLITAVFSGKLLHAELSAIQKEAGEIIRGLGKARILVISEQFDGWEKEGDWGDVSFQCENDPFIDKIAIVGDKKWEGLAVIFAGKGVRRPAIEFFPTEELAKARLWLAAGS
jgi:hypothetical protein